MKFTLVATVLLTFSLSAFAVEYPVLTTARPEQVGFDSQKLHRLDGWIQNQIDAGYPSINLLVIKIIILFYKKPGAMLKNMTVPRC